MKYPMGSHERRWATTCDSQHPDAAHISTDLNYKIWARKLINDQDSVFILAGVKEGFHLIQQKASVLPTFTRNSKLALKPGAREQIEEQFNKGLEQGH